MAKTDRSRNFKKSVHHLPKVTQSFPAPSLSHTEALQFDEELRSTQPKISDAISLQADKTVNEVLEELNRIKVTDRFVLTETELRSLMYRVSKSSSARALLMVGDALHQKHGEVQLIERILFHPDRPAHDTN